MKKLMLSIFLFTFFVSINVHASPILSQQIRTALENRDYMYFKQLLIANPQIALLDIIQEKGEADGGKELFLLLDTLVLHTNWMEDMQLFLLTNKTIRAAYTHNLSPDMRKQCAKLIAIAETATQAKTPIVRPMDPNYNLESIKISKEALSGLKKDKNTIVHVANQYLRRPYRKWQASRVNMSFSQYLKTYATRAEKKKIYQNMVIYLSPNDAKQYIVTFENGKLMQNGHVMTNELFIFTLDAETGVLFAAPKKDEYFHHSSFTRGEPVICSGKFYVKDGTIGIVKLKSGHYKPTAADGEKLRQYLSHPSRLGSKAANLIIHAKTLRRIKNTHQNR